MHNPPDSRTELEQLAVALTQQGYDATVITPAPYLAIRIPGAALPQIIYSTGGQLWWHTPQVIAPTQHTRLATEIITWALRAHPHQPAASDATSPLATPLSQLTPPAPATPAFPWTGPDGEPALADVQREFPGYECWRAVSGLYYARLPGRPRADVQGEDARDLRDQIIRHQAQTDEQAWQAAQAPSSPVSTEPTTP